MSSSIQGAPKDYDSPLALPHPNDLRPVKPPNTMPVYNPSYGGVKEPSLLDSSTVKYGLLFGGIFSIGWLLWSKKSKRKVQEDD